MQLKLYNISSISQIQPKDRIISHDLPDKPWEVIRVGVFLINAKNFLCIIEYFNKFPKYKRVEKSSDDSLKACSTIVFMACGLTRKVI